MVHVTGPELVGNALCLDFANTVNARPDPTRDWLADPADVDDWARNVGLDGRPAGTLSELHELREAVYRTFSAVAAGNRPAAADLDLITAIYAEAVEAARLVPANTAYGTDRRQPRTADAAYRADGRRQGAGDAAYGADGRRPRTADAAYVLDWARPTTDRHVRWAVVESAMDLLRQGPLDRIGECPSCGWLFVDTSRNGRRRWCSMAMCGNRVKSARHYAARSAGTPR